MTGHASRRAMHAPAASAEMEVLRARLEVAEETLRALSRGEVDAVVRSGPAGSQVFTLEGADRPYRLMVETMAEGAVTLMPDGVVLYCNRRFAQIAGQRLDQVMGAHVQDLVTPTHQALLLDVIKAQSGKPAKDPPAIPARIFVDMVKTDGSVTPTSWAARSFGTPAAPSVLAVVTDLTEITEKQRQVAALNAQIAAIVENAGEAIIGKNLQGVVTSWNKGAERLYGYTADEMIGQNVDILAPPERKDQIHELIAEIRHGEEVVHCETERITKAGHQLDVLITLSPVRNSAGALVGVSTIATDITARRRAERAAAAAGRYARSLIEASLDPLVTISREGKITDVNKATEGATGCSRAELIGTDFADYFTEPEKARAGYQEAFEKGSVTDYALVLMHRAGAVMDVLYNANVYRDENGTVTGLFAAARNVTARRRAEQVRARALRALHLLNTCNQKIIRAADEESLLQGVCHSLIDVGGYRLAWVGYAEEDEAKTIRPAAQAGVGSTDYVNQIRVTWSDKDEHGRGPGGTAIRTGQAMVVRDTQRDPTFALWREAAAAKGLLSAASVPLKDNDKTYGGLMVYAGEPDVFDADELSLLNELAADLTFAITALRAKAARDKAEKDLRAAFDYGRSLIEANPDPLVVVGRQGNITDLNAAAVAVAGIDRNRILGSDFAGYATDPDKAHAAFEVAFEKGFLRDFPLSIRSGSGRVIDFLYNAAVYRDSTGQPAGIVAAGRDMTERNRIEQELQAHRAHLEDMVAGRTADLATANKELETFAYSVSHDLRAPLRAISGFSNILLEDYADKLDAEGQRLLGVVRDGAVKMGQLIEDILAFSRAGRVEMTRQAVDMDALVRASINELESAIAGRTIDFEVAALPPALGDPAMLQRVWQNLLGNAIKYTAPKPRARIAIGATPQDGETIYFVRDDGVGFDMKYVDKLFGVFQRLHGVEFAGTGIGLAIVKRIITRHDGRVWAEGKVGEGATFYFSLPSREASHA